MENNIKELEIKNFKSIKHIKFNPKRINVFIGKPNVGKSNILEGMGLLTGLINRGEEDAFFSDGILRFSDMTNLFHDLEINENNIEVTTDTLNTSITFDEEYFICLAIDKSFKNTIKTQFINEGLTSAILDEKNDLDEIWDFFRTIKKSQSKGDNKYSSLKLFSYPFIGYYTNEGELTYFSDIVDFNKFKNPIRKYSYKEFRNHNDIRHSLYLTPPFGENLFSVLETKRNLLNEIASFFEEQNLEFVLLKNQDTFSVQKKVDRYVSQFPYSSIADTLKRVIFYLAAIETNKDAVLLFEEPEVHSYPPYIKMLADRIVLDDENQYFLSTHSPYMLNTLIDSLGNDELNVVLTYYEDYQTKIKVLNSEELSEMQQMGVDVFFNLDKFEGEKVVS
jgi:hypothetical protein